MKRLIFILCLAAIVLASCGKENEEAVIVDTEAQESGGSYEVELDGIVEEPDIEAELELQDVPEEQPKYLSYTTGLSCTEEELAVRPIAVMYNNNKISYPQNGISSADIVYECDAEGGVTRLMAIFSDWKSLSEIGSVRSARDYFISLAELHGAIYVHAGGSPSAYTVLKKGNIDYIDGVNMNNLPSGIFYRSNYRIKHNGYEHSLMTDGSKIAKAVDFCQYGEAYNEDFSPPLKFSADKNTVMNETAVDITLKHSSYVTVRFEYSDELGTYSKYSFNSPHTDGLNGDQLAFENVLVLFVSQKVVDSEGRLDIDVTSGGDGYYFNDGKYTKISWSRSKDNTAYTFTTEDGEITLSPGKTHITLFNKNQKDKIIIK